MSFVLHLAAVVAIVAVVVLAGLLHDAVRRVDAVIANRWSVGS